MKRILTIAVLLVVSSHLQAQDDEQLRKLYYGAFENSNNEQFYAVSRQMKDRFLENGDRSNYYKFCVNEVMYEIRQNNNTKALKIANDVLHEMQEHEDGRYDLIYNAMGSIYDSRGNYRMAKRCLELSLAHLLPNDTTSMIGTYISMTSLEAAVHPDSALVWADRLLPLCWKYPTHYCYGLMLKALAHFYKNDAAGFFEVRDELLIHLRENNISEDNNEWMIKTLRLALDGNYNEALERIDSDKSHIDAIGHYNMRLQVYRMMGNKDMIIHEQQQKMDVLDSLNSDMIYENLNEINAEINLIKTQQKASQDRTILMSLLMVLLIVIIGLLLWRYLTRRNLQKELMAQNKKLEIALLRAEESDRMKNSFIEHVSHEIRTPLNVITGYAQVITNPDYDLQPDMRDHMLKDISRNTVEITNIVNELLEVAQDESRQHYERNDQVAVNTFCRQVLKTIESLNVHHLEIDFITDITDDFTMKTNKVALNKILSQLLDNALKFTNEGKVELYVYDSPDHGMVRFVVTDTGIGIAEEHQEQIFDRFFKVDSFKPGFGLGLTMAQKMATLLDGSLYLDKEYKEGARFVMTLPAT